MNDDMYYLQDSRGYVGNDLLFWAKGSAGYTTNLEEAELFDWCGCRVMKRISPFKAEPILAFLRSFGVPQRFQEEFAKKLDQYIAAQSALRAANDKRMRKQCQRLIECRHLVGRG